MLRRCPWKDKFAAAETDERKQKLAQRAVRKDEKFERQKFGAYLYCVGLFLGAERCKTRLSGAGLLQLSNQAFNH